MKNLMIAFLFLCLTVGPASVAMAGYDASHDHHEHHDSKGEHMDHVEAIEEAIELLEGSHPELAERLEEVAEHHENL